MRIKEINLGNGVFRLVAEPMTVCERNIPTHIVEEMIKDVIRNKKGCVRVEEPRGFEPKRCCETRPWERPVHNFGCVEPRPMPKPNREPDGIDVHVDRPLREKFYSHRSWADAMAKYRTLERVAKDCNWECREPMKGTHPNYNFVKPTCSCVNEEPFFDDEDDEVYCFVF